MLRTLLFVLFWAQTTPFFAQKTYFQQDLQYQIQVTLDDRQHRLDGHIRMAYTNRSPDALPEIWMHLWANAFQSRSSAYCRQKLRDGNAQFYFSPDSTLGFFKNIDFRVDGQPVAWQIDPKNPDIAVLRLAQALLPGGTVVIETPFLLHIPASFSRLGHVGSSYQLTQWYPKPAVYDAKGWHAMPYLDMGEFFSEFGSFDVSITLPENYVVGATGALQTPSEIEFLQQKERETRQEIARRAGNAVVKKSKKQAVEAPFPASASATKTIRYTADRVHDFAWFADKRFFVLKDTAHLGSGKTVDCWAMFTAEDFDLWEKGAFYVRRSLEFYSRHVGEYPWPQATAVHSALSAGGGMEYPMVTVIGDASSGKSLDDVITHEVGHNWFYGILASNERDHPWMDEGINTYYQHRYMVQYYGTDGTNDMLPRWAFDPSASGPVVENGYLMLAREGADTPPDTPSDDFWSIAYGIQVYMKTAMCLEWLEHSVGKARFDDAMQQYYRQWQFRHPYPEDLRAAWAAAGLEVDWFFQGMQTRRRFDLALTRVERTQDSVFLTVKQRGSLAAPFSISALRNGQPVQTIWYPALEQSRTVVAFPAVEAEVFVLDQEHTTLDVNRRNNSRRTSGIFPGVEPLRIKMLSPAQMPARSVAGILPWLGWNNYDKTMLGLVLYNPPFPSRRFQYFMLPGYGIGSKHFVGMADVRYRFLPGELLPKVTLGVNAKLLNYDRNRRDDYYLRFYRIMPQLRAELRSSSPSFAHALVLRALLIGKEEAEFASTGEYLDKNWQHTTIYELRYEAAQRKLPNPYRLTAALEQQAYQAPDGQPAQYLRGSLEWNQQFYYQAKRKVYLRAFAGYFLQNTQRARGSVAQNSLTEDVARASFALNPQGFNDYRFDQIFLGRSEASGIWAQQISQTEGGFKNALGAPFANLIGNSNDFILALNLKADLPQRLPLGIPLKPYFDIGYFHDATPLGRDRPFEEQFLWSGGLMLQFFNGALELYFPLVNARPLRDRYQELGNGNYFRRISWSIRIGKVTPLEVVQNLVN
ncbi:MAG: M1 family metallopeptidase [Saprospiraceae bacterium]|nr:M1 family metallopeptidase [Saprospiraceae bacterium]